ncbi:hypothetical protein BJX62DRAFT_213744 [Aspergillus germanicus]
MINQLLEMSFTLRLAGKLRWRRRYPSTVIRARYPRGLIPVNEGFVMNELVRQSWESK